MMYSKKFRLPIGLKTKAAKKIFSSPYFLIKATSNNCGCNRFAIVIPSASVKKSTKRNFWKRRIADEVKQWPNVEKDFVIIVSPKINDADVGEVRELLRSAGGRIR